MSDVSTVPVAILAGGLATRLGPASRQTPKALMPVAGKPFIEHQLALLKRENVHRVVLLVGHLGEILREHVGTGARFGLDVTYSFDGEQLLGTGGALRRALPLLGDVFFVLYGDSYLDIPLAPVLDAFRKSGEPALMTVFRNDGQWDTSNVLFDGSHVIGYDKRAPTPEMRYIDYGLGIITSKLIRDFPAAANFDLADIYGALSAAGHLAGYEAEHRFYEIGTPAGLAETDAFLRRRA